MCFLCVPRAVRKIACALAVAACAVVAGAVVVVYVSLHRHSSHLWAVPAHG